MKVKVNGKELEFPERTTLREALEGEPYSPGAAVSVLISRDYTRSKTDEYEIVFKRGSVLIKLDDSPEADLWRSVVDDLKGNNVRWNTSKILAIGSFPTSIDVDMGEYMRKKYDVFFSLGGFDNKTTYMMISKHNHRGRYGAGPGRIGKLTRGRYLVDELQEAEEILDIRPVVKETSSENSIITTDLDMVLAEGQSVESYLLMELWESSPLGAEHVLITLRDGIMNVSEHTNIYISCSDNISQGLDITGGGIRDAGYVTVRVRGKNTGKIYIYKRRIHPSESHTRVGKVIQGCTLLNMAEAGQKLKVITRPERILSVGMTQAEGMDFLNSHGIEQERYGDTSDEAIIVEQDPEMTLEVLTVKKVRTYGVRTKDIFPIKLYYEAAPKTVRYFKKVTGLDHKPIGSLQVYFTYEGLPMITFEGDNDGGKSLYPENEFEESYRGQIGVTNQVRPHAGLLGIRLRDDKEYGPTGEEPYGTNIVGEFLGDLNHLLDGIKEGQKIYIKEYKENG
ncbi:MAG: hypothetical protein PWQ62_754 [Candidatus Methanomethylophilaceae archaeon]|nr:hypothetical protein [Candidatus Methanomethylophilaceae archaeon]